MNSRDDCLKVIDRFRFDSQAVVVTFNMYCFPLIPPGTYRRSQVIIFTKADLTSGAPDPTRSSLMTGFGAIQSFTLQPASVVAGNPGNVFYMIETPVLVPSPALTAKSLRLWAINSPLDAPSLQNTLVTIPSNGGQSGDGLTNGAPECLFPNTLPTLTLRTQNNSFWLNGTTWTCHTAGGSARAMVYYYQVNTNGYPVGTPTLAESGGIDAGPGVWNYLPSIGGAANGNVALVYTQSSTTMCPRMMVTTRAPGRRFATPVAILSSPVEYKGNRWGDYATVAPDPIDGSLWVAHEWAKTPPFATAKYWSTYWANIMPSPCPTLAPAVTDARLAVGGLYTCPAADDGARYVVTVELPGCSLDIESGRVTLEALPVNTADFATAFFPQSTAQLAGSDATSTNGFTTTITERQIGGCTGDSVDVYLDGVVIGKAWFPPTPSVDLDGSGNVDAGDLARLASTLSLCAGAPGYIPCADFLSGDQCVGAGELSTFAAHLGHDWTTALGKGGRLQSAVTKLTLDPSSPAGTGMFEVRLEGLQGQSVVGVVLRPAAKLRFTKWIPRPEHTGRVFAFPGVDSEGPRLALLVLGVTPDGSGNLELGMMSFTAASGAVSANDLPISYESVASADAIASGQVAQESALPPTASVLAQNEPNPFNPQTTIRYKLEQDTPVKLVVFDVAGRHVRTLASGTQAAGEHAAVWDGHDNTGRAVQSGIYLYRLTTRDFDETKKLVILR